MHYLTKITVLATFVGSMAVGFAVPASANCGFNGERYSCDGGGDTGSYTAPAPSEPTPSEPSEPSFSDTDAQ